MTPSLAKPNVLFLVQCFESKGYLDSAGHTEIVAPMAASGLLGRIEVHSWGKDLNFFHQYVAHEIDFIAKKVGRVPVIVYGAGAHSEEFFKEFSALNLVGFSDSNPVLWNKPFLDLEIIEPDQIRKKASHVLISSRVWDREITRLLREQHPELSVYPLYEGLMAQNELYLQKQLDHVKSHFAKDRFDLIVYCPASPAEAFSDKHFEQLRNYFDAKLATVWWDYDESNASNDYMQFERCSLRYSDAVIDPGNFTKNLRLKSGQPPFHLHQGGEKVHVLPTAFDPNLFFPRPKEWSHPLAMFGSVVGGRRNWKQFLQECYGERFRHVGGVYQGRTPVPMAEYARLLSITPIVVNTQTYEFRSQCKGKVREVLACGGLLLEEDNPESRIFFEKQDFMDFFSNTEQLHSLTDHYLQHPCEAEAKGLAGYHWYQKNWSARPWTEKFLSLF